MKTEAYDKALELTYGYLEMAEEVEDRNTQRELLDLAHQSVDIALRLTTLPPYAKPA